ncbi:MAG: hypothetical protein Tsb007_42270 [Rhizobacter sp.]
MHSHWMTRACRSAFWLLFLGVAPLAHGAEEAPAPGVVSRAVPNTTAWRVRTPADDKVAYRGAVSFEKAGIGSMGILYPAPNLIGLFAAVLTHGLIADSAQEKKKAEIRAEADKVLLPYQPVLEKITHGTLFEQGLAKTTRGAGKRLLGTAEVAQGEWVIETIPVFSMTQDERALVLDNAIAVRSPETPAVVFYQNVVRVVSMPRPPLEDKAALLNHWSAEEGLLLRKESAALFAESLDLVLAELEKGPDTAELMQKTVRYPEGGGERMERAALLSERCDRVLLKTLRGGLMSVPRPIASGTSCESERSVAAPAEGSKGQ